MILAVENLQSFYGSSQAVFDVSFEMDEGTIVALFGRNGAGKTTTLRSIMGLHPPTCRGTITFRGEDITDLSSFEIANKGIGFVPEDRRVFPSLSVQRNLTVGKKGGNGDADWDLGRVYEVFPKLEELEGSLGSNLSGGEQQMLTIARSLMGNPELILLDEPTEGLAPLIARDVLDLIIELSEEHRQSILLVEQFSARVLDYLSMCYIMVSGELTHKEAPEKIAEDEELQQELLGVS